MSGYYSCWYEFEPKFRKLLVLFIQRSQKPLELTAGGFFTMSLDMFTTILSRSYSYVAVLRQMYADSQ